MYLTVADPGFPRRGGANSKAGCEKLLISQFFPKKLYEKERIRTPGGGGAAHVPGAPVRSANALYDKSKLVNFFLGQVKC